jgi:hypothetical protein
MVYISLKKNHARRSVWARLWDRLGGWLHGRATLPPILVVSTAPLLTPVGSQELPRTQR